jgi:hypothetical protein
MNTIPRAAEAARLVEDIKTEARIEGDSRYTLRTSAVAFHKGAEFAMNIAIDRLRDLASRADSPVGELAAGEVADADDKLLIGQAQHLIGALMNHGLLAKGLPEDLYLKLWDVVKGQLRCVNREGALAALAAVEAKPTAAEVTGKAFYRTLLEVLKDSLASVKDYQCGLEFGAHDRNLIGRLKVEIDKVSARPVATPSASPSEAQKAGAPMDFALLVSSARNVVAAFAKGQSRWELSAAIDELVGTLDATHPSAGAGVPQEVAMLTPEQIDELPLPREPDHYEKLAFATAIQRTLAAAWGIRLKGEGA